MTRKSRYVAETLLFAAAACLLTSQSALGAEHKKHMYELGLSVLSTPRGNDVPFAEKGIGFTAQFLYFLEPRIVAGAEFGWHAAGFDRDALFDEIGGLDDDKLSTSSYTMFEWAFMVRVEPAELAGWHPFLGGGFSIMGWHEKYSYNDLSWGPYFPSGTLIEVDQSISAPAWVAGGGIRYESQSGVGCFVEAQELFANGSEIDGRWTRLRGGVSWRR